MLKRIVYAVLFSVLIISFLFTKQMHKRYVDMVPEKRFISENNMKFQRVCVFVSREKGLDKEKINEIQNFIYEKLKYSPALQEDSNKVFLDAYAAVGQVLICNETDDLDCEAIFIGGTYFDFHNKVFLSGNKLLDDALSKDQVVISEMLSFRLFGSNDCIGRVLWIDNNAFVISGVMKDEKGFINKQAGEKREKIYLSYEMMQKTGCDRSVTSYEIILPQPIRGFARKTVEEAFGIDVYNKNADLIEKEIVIKIESDRFQPLNLVREAFHLNDRTVKKIPLQFPDWENEKIIVENYLILIYMLRFVIICLFLPRIVRALKRLRLLSFLKKTEKFTGLEYRE